MSDALHQEINRWREELRLLLEAFTKHRKSTHVIGTSVCHTCKESDDAIRRADDALEQGLM